MVKIKKQGHDNELLAHITGLSAETAGTLFVASVQQAL